MIHHFIAFPANPLPEPQLIWKIWEIWLILLWSLPPSSSHPQSWVPTSESSNIETITGSCQVCSMSPRWAIMVLVVGRRWGIGGLVAWWKPVSADGVGPVYLSRWLRRIFSELRDIWWDARAMTGACCQRNVLHSILHSQTKWCMVHYLSRILNYMTCAPHPRWRMLLKCKTSDLFCSAPGKLHQELLI